MEQKSPDELMGRQGHLLPSVSVRGIPVRKRHLIIRHADQAVVADGHTMGLSTQVIQHPPRILKRGFDVNTPFDVVEAGQESIECRLASQMSYLSGKLEFSPLVRLLQCNACISLQLLP